MTVGLVIKRFKGRDILPFIPDLAKLRLKIFYSYPYLFDGDTDYETNYLRTYVECPHSIAVIVFHQDKVVGISTAIPLAYETIEFQQPFLDHNYNLEQIFYLGESVLENEYRGKGIYRRFFEERERAAIEYGSKIAAFSAVERAKDDPRKPANYVPLDEVWKHFGYEKHPELCANFEWKEIGETKQSAKPLMFWIKQL